MTETAKKTEKFTSENEANKFLTAGFKQRGI